MKFKAKYIGWRISFTNGKIYKVKNGQVIDDDGDERGENFTSFAKLQSWYPDEWELVEEPREDVKMNGNFKMIAKNEDSFMGITNNKIYEVKDGTLTLDDGGKYTGYDNFEQFKKSNVTVGGFELYKEPTPTESITIRRKKSKVIAVLSIDGEFKYSQYIKLVDANGDFKTAVKMVVDRLMDKWNGEDGVDLTAEVVKRHANVGEYIELLVDKNNYHKGDILKITHFGCLASVWDGNNEHEVTGFHTDEYVILEDYIPIVENPIKKVKRPAKVGEWIEVVDVHKEYCNGYNNGDILKVEELYYGGEGIVKLPHHIISDEYLVLENYTPEVVGEVVAPMVVPTPKFVKAKAGDKIEIIKVGRFHVPSAKIGDIFIVDEVNYSDIGTTAGNLLDDKDEEYIIIENAPIKISDKIVSACTQEELMKELFNRQGL